MHLANDVPTQGNQAGNHLADYPPSADLLVERTLDGLLAEHPGELIRTGENLDEKIIDSYLTEFRTKLSVC